MCSKCSVVNYHTVLLAFALTVSPTASPKSSEKLASSRRPENGQRLAGNVGNPESRHNQTPVVKKLSLSRSLSCHLMSFGRRRGCRVLLFPCSSASFSGNDAVQKTLFPSLVH